MRNLTTKFLLAAAALLIAASATRASAQAIIFVANESVKASAISEADARDVFLGNTISLSGSKVSPVLLQSGPAHAAFLKILGKTDYAFEASWRMQVFTGKGIMPRSFNNEDALLAYVRMTPGAIGYISTDKIPAGVQVIRLK